MCNVIYIPPRPPESHSHTFAVTYSHSHSQCHSHTVSHPPNLLPCIVWTTWVTLSNCHSHTVTVTQSKSLSHSHHQPPSECAQTCVCPLCTVFFCSQYFVFFNLYYVLFCTAVMYILFGHLCECLNSPMQLSLKSSLQDVYVYTFDDQKLPLLVRNQEYRKLGVRVFKS